jgi:P27 family predicted phage terminase small subunit
MKLAKGETRPSRVNFDSPHPRDRAPVQPKDLDPDAVAIWRHVLREMPPGVILAVDRDMLRAYVETVAHYVRDNAMLLVSGPIIRGQRDREVVANPLARIVREEREQMRLLGRELGLSPAARSALRVDTSGGGVDMDDIIGVHPRLRAVPDAG